MFPESSWSGSPCWKDARDFYRGSPARPMATGTSCSRRAGPIGGWGYRTKGWGDWRMPLAVSARRSRSSRSLRQLTPLRPAIDGRWAQTYRSLGRLGQLSFGGSAEALRGPEESSVLLEELSSVDPGNADTGRTWPRRM